MQIVEIKNEANSWKVDDAEVWYHTKKKCFYCWSCGCYYCEHVAQLRAHLTPLAVDGANAFCKCVDPHFDIVESCGVCGKPPRH